MIDQAGILMQQGATIACERVSNRSVMSKSHYHTHYEFYYLEDGHRLHMMDDVIYETQAGDFMIFAPFVMHHSYSEDQSAFKRIVLYFTEDLIGDPELQKMMREASGLYRPDIKLGQDVHKLLNMLLSEQSESGPLHMFSMKTLLNMLLVAVIKSGHPAEKPEMQSQISKIISYIDQNYAEEIHLDDLANQFYISKYYLCREFKKCTNRTISQYINAARILNAQRRIMETDHNFTKIAADTGFASLTHFNRTFKAVTGLTPTAFRKTLKGEKRLELP